MSDVDVQPLCIEVPMVVGVGECQVVVASKLRLSTDATEIKRVTKTVRVDDYAIANGSVLIDGTVIKNVEYQRTDNLIGSDRFEVPFDCCMKVPGARSGDRFKVQSGRVCAERDEIVSAPSNDLFEKLCVRVAGTVTRQVQITVTPDQEDQCPRVSDACDGD